MRGSDFYGIQNIFCTYAGVRWRGFFPYAVQHGWQIAATSYESTDSPLEIWVWSSRIKSDMSKFYDPDRIRVVGSPYLYLPRVVGTNKFESAGVYVLPHSSHFARIGFSNEDLKVLLLRLRARHSHLVLLVYYLDVTSKLCDLVKQLGLQMAVCGGLWSKDFLINFKKIISNSYRLYYSSFGSAVLFAQYDGIEVEYVPLFSRVEYSENAHVNELAASASLVQSDLRWDINLELGLDQKLSSSECRELISRGYKAVSFGQSLKKTVANIKNSSIDHLKNLAPALKKISD